MKNLFGAFLGAMIALTFSAFVSDAWSALSRVDRRDNQNIVFEGQTDMTNMYIDGTSVTAVSAAEMLTLNGLGRASGTFASTAALCTIVTPGLDGIGDIIGYSLDSADSAYAISFYKIAAGSLGVTRPGDDVYHIVGDSVIVTYADTVPG